MAFKNPDEDDVDYADGVASQSVDSFWGVELSAAKNKVYEWTDEQDDETEDDMDTIIELRQACLGVDAKEKERNVVQLTTENEEGEMVTHTILSMRLGVNEQNPMFLTLRPPVKFELVKGSGPVHLVGQTISTLTDIDEDEFEDEEEEEEEEEVTIPEPTTKKGKKRPAPALAAPKSNKVAKRAEVKVEEESDGDEDEEDDEDEEGYSEDGETPMDIPKKSKKSVEDEDDEDDDEDDDSFDEDEDDESEEEVKAPPPKKKTPNGTPGSKKVLSKTPQPLKSSLKSSLKTPLSASKVTDAKKSVKTNKPPSVEEIKKRLINSPNLPKKLERFNNYMANTYKVTDAATKKQLWEFVQKSKK